VSLHTEGLSAKYLAVKFDVNISKVTRTIKIFKKFQEFGHLGGNGRPSI
jgi:hypothetical protein